MREREYVNKKDDCMMNKLSIIIPLFNEEEAIPYLYNRLIKVAEKIDNYDLEFLFVNDGSKDGSLNLIKEYKKSDDRITYLSLSRNYGKEIAMKAAIDYVNSDVVVIMDADLQHPPELILEMLKFYHLGYDDVYGKRKGREKESFLKRSCSKIFYKILSSITYIPVEDGIGDFRLLSRKAVNALKQLNEKQRYSKGLFSLIGFNKKCIEFEVEERVAGNTKWSFIKLINLAVEGITSFSIAPLRIATVCGTLCAMASFIYFIITIIQTLVMGIDVPGYASLLCISLLLGGIQLIALGLIGEYIGRIFMEVKNRPLYFVDEYSNSKVMEKVYEVET